MPDATRMTPERHAEIRYMATTYAAPVPASDVRALLAELDAVTRERDDLKRCQSTWNGRQCRDVNGHGGIHIAEDESNWIDGDGQIRDSDA